MQSILIIEPSSTLRHALRRLLDHHYQVVTEEEFSRGLHQLHSSRFDAVVLGWPNQTQAVTDELLALLSDDPLIDLPVLTLAHEPDPAKLNWISGRPHSAFLLWENYYDIRETLVQLLNTSVPILADEEDGDIISVLLVDDSPTARVKFSRLLKDSGHYQVTTASSVEEALEKLEHASVEIAIIDYFMPDQNGDALCRILREKSSTANIVSAILTSTYSDKVITDALAAGAVECMFKNEPDNLFLARVSAMRRTVNMTRGIEQKRRHLEGILASVGDGVYGVNRDGIVTFANPAVGKIMGFEKQSLIGKSAQETLQIYCPVDQEHGGTCNLDKTLQQGQPQHAVESTFIRSDGTPIHVEETIYPLNINGQHEGAVIAFRDISVRKLLEEELKWQVNHDSLTKLLNRKYLEDSLEEELNRLSRSDDLSALLYIDLDRFKYINDTIGHTAGDQLLVELSDLLHTRLRRSDLLARIGGDEFGVLLREVDIEKMQTLCENIHSLLSGYTFNFLGRSYKVHASIGAAIIDATSKSAGEVLANADIACAIAKSKGRNQTHIYSAEQDEKASMDMELGWSVRLQQALDNDQFVLHYQPIIDLASIEIESLDVDADNCWDQIQNFRQPDEMQIYEVLLRLKGSNGDLISPTAFLPTAERFNLMPRIDAWVVKNALEVLNRLNNRNIQFSINLSGQSLHTETLVNLLRDSIEQSQLDTQQILLEITESCAIYDNKSAKCFIRDIMQLGCSFALDDFGSGYSSFAYLKNLPVDVIKIDGTFIKDMLNDPMDMAIVTSINNIAHSLGKKTIAEFVENLEILKQLKAIGLDYVQGNYISLPMEDTIFENTLPLTNANELPDTFSLL